MIPLMLFIAIVPGDGSPEYLLSPITVVYDDSIMDHTWFGMFLTDSGCELREVSIELEDEMPDGANIRIPGESREPLFIVCSSETLLTPGPLIAFLCSNELFTSSFILRYEACTFFSIPGSQEARLYTNRDGLFLTDGEIIQQVSETKPTYCGNAFISIVWAGDLDRDGKVDLVLNDVNGADEIYDWCLYLSTEAGPGQLLREVASSRGCFL